MAHIVVPTAEALLDQRLPVLDKGHVLLLDYLGGDARVVQSARTSYGPGTKTVSEDQNLVNYLMKNAHTSPFEQVSLVFHLKLPLFVFAQLVRHRTAKLNAMSARYSVMEEEFYFPGKDGWRGQSTSNKQVGDQPLPYAENKELVIDYDQEVGRATRAFIEGALGGPHDTIDDGDHPTRFVYSTAMSTFEEQCKIAYCEYEQLIEEGVSREQARMILPQNLYTDVVWQIDLHNLFHFLGLRLDWHAQKEIRDYAEAMATCAKAVAPMCWEAFEEHKLHARRFSRTEVEALRLLWKARPYSDVVDVLGDTKRVAEFEQKLWN
jgi:thymidylate synthase (FAD)